MGDLRTHGFALIPAILTPEECEQAARQVTLDAAGTRCLLSQPWCATLAMRLRDHPALAGVIDPDMVAVQCTWFEKSADRNWLVPVHQDLSIPVAARVIDPAFSGWSVKEGIHFVRAPVEVLSQLVAVRIHLDPCGTDDGPLRVVPGSHTLGIVTDAEALALRAVRGEMVCVAPVGTALALRPLLLHASSKGSGTSLRRVLHFVFGPAQLPLGLAWSSCV